MTRSLIELEIHATTLTTKYKEVVSILSNQDILAFDLHFVAPLIRAMQELVKEYQARYDQHKKQINKLETECQQFQKGTLEQGEVIENLQARLLDLENKLTIKDHTIRRLDHEKQELIKQVQKLDEVLMSSQPINREMLEKIQQAHSHKFDNFPPEECTFEELVGEPMTDPAQKAMLDMIENMKSEEYNATFAPPMNQESKPISQPVTQFSTGAVRSTDANSTRYDLISPVGLRRIAETYAEGAIKYGDNNWQKGMPASDTMNHALRHLNLWLSGDKTEDHLAHAAWNLFAIMHFEELKPDCIDVPTRRTT